jgi:septal ring factor EnvC (AmiA/AmiB activator)
MKRRTCQCLVPVFALVVAGCATASTDPHTGGLAGGIAGITTGSYEKRLDERQAAIDDLDQAGAALNGRIGAANDRIRDLERRLASRTNNLQRMRAELAEIDKSIATIRVTNAAKQGTLSSVEAVNQNKNAVLTPLISERNKLQTMVEELESNHRREASDYQQLKAAPPAPATPAGRSSEDIQVAEMERRARELDQKQYDAAQRIEKLKTSTKLAGV